MISRRGIGIALSPLGRLAARARGASPCIAWVAVALSVPAVTAQETAGPKDVMVEVQRANRDLTLWINGIPAARIAGEGSTFFLRATTFFVDGANEIRLVWVRRGESLLPFQAQVLVWPRGRSRDEATALVDYTHEADEPEGAALSRTFEVEVDVPTPWRWQRGVGVEGLGAADRRAIVSELRSLHTTLTSKDPVGLASALGPMTAELAGNPPGIMDRLVEGYARAMRDASWSVAPFSEADVRLRPYGRMVEVSAPGPVLAATFGDSSLRLDRLFFASIDGVWTLVAQGSS